MLFATFKENAKSLAIIILLPPHAIRDLFQEAETVSSVVQSFNDMRRPCFFYPTNLITFDYTSLEYLVLESRQL